MFDSYWEEFMPNEPPAVPVPDRRLSVGQQLQAILVEFGKIHAVLEEVLRRLPEPRCKDCGMLLGFHRELDHEFVI